MNNRSVPTDTLMAHVVYRDVAAAIEWLTRVFGFMEHFRYGDPAAPSGAQIRFGKAWMMLHSPRPHTRSPAELGYCTQSVSLYLEDVDAHYARVKAQGAEIVEELRETIYGERGYCVNDLEGHCWEFSQHVLDVSPEEWGATVVNQG